MPIKFRCNHCNQLMGIARRKAGTDVHCPTCNGVLRVPLQDSEDAGAPAAGAVPIAAPQPAFENSDFEAYLRADVHNQPVVTAPPPAVGGPPLPGTVWSPHAVDVEPASLPTAALPPGIVLSNGLATLLTIAIIFLMALSFSLGLLVGRAL
jgi:phage FluMu protein Com